MRHGAMGGGNAARAYRSGSAAADGPCRGLGDLALVVLALEGCAAGGAQGHTAQAVRDVLRCQQPGPAQAAPGDGSPGPIEAIAAAVP